MARTDADTRTDPGTGDQATGVGTAAALLAAARTSAGRRGHPPGSDRPATRKAST